MTITTIRREYSPGLFTTDILVNGEIWTRAVGADILPEILARVARAVAIRQSVLG